MKKLIGVLLVVLLLCAVFAGCSASDVEGSQTTTNEDAVQDEATSDETKAGETESDEKEEVTISFMTWRSEDAEVYNTIVESFMAEYPYINVDIEITSSNQDEYYSVLTTKLSGNSNSVDVFAVHGGARLTEYVEAGKLLNLKDAAVVDNYNSELLGFGTVEDGIYGLPQAYNSYLIFYNKGIFEQYGLKAPTSWAEMQNVVSVLKDNDVDTISAGFAEDWVFDMVVLPLVAAYNTEDAKMLSKVEKGEIGFSDETISGVFEDIQAMSDEGFFINGAQGTTYESSIAVFSQGKSAMLLTGTWSIGTLQTQAPDIDLGYFLLPARNADPIMLADASYLIGINADSPQSEAAMLFAEYISSPEIAALYSEKTGQLSPVLGVVSQDEDMAAVTKMFEDNTIINNPNRYLTSSEFISIYTSTAAKAFLGESIADILQQAQTARDAIQ